MTLKTLQAKARKQFFATSGNHIDIPIGEFILHNGETLKEIVEVQEALDTIIASTVKEFGEEVIKIIDEQDPSSSRTTSPIYWGNALRKAIRSLTETV